jgi:hypothetical protein
MTEHYLQPVPFTLVGRDGNPFALIGGWKAAAVDAGWPPEAIKNVVLDATNGDYDHLLSVLMDVSEDEEDES